MTTEKFYFIRNGQQIGPIEAEQLAHENITPQTMVWRQGMEDWKEARLLPELDFLWQNNANNGASGVPPFQAPPRQQPFAPQNNTPYNTYANGGIPPKCPPTYLAFAIIVTIFCTWPLGIPAIINATRVEKAYNQGDFAGAERFSKAARSWSIASMAVAVALVLLWGVIVFFSAVLDSAY